MALFLFKLIGAPLFLAAPTLAARRWGETVGGLIIALPLVSGPISVVLAVEHGADFAVNAALGSLVGTAALAFFGVVYAAVCPRGRIVAILTGLTAFAASSWILKALNLSLWPLFILTVVLLMVGAYFIPVSKASAKPQRPPKYDLCLRMGFMALMMLAVTGAAPFIGPEVSGIVSSFPMMALTMALFAQTQSGAGEAQNVMAGLVKGLLSGAVFYWVLSLTLTDAALWQGYAAASVVTLMLQGFVLYTLRRGRR